MKEIKSGYIGKKSKIYEIELADLIQLREIVAESWPREGYLLHKSGKTYMINKNLMINLTEEAEKVLANKEAEVKKTDLENIQKVGKVCTNENTPDNEQISILHRLDAIEQQLSVIPKSFEHSFAGTSYEKNDSSEMIECFDDKIRDFQENFSIYSDKINRTMANMADSIKRIEGALSYFSGLSIELEDVNKKNPITNVDDVEISSLLRELYRTSCEMNKVILDTALKFIMDEPVRN